MPLSIFKLLAAKLYPERAAAHLTRRRLRQFAQDANNVTDFAALRTLLLPYEVVSFDFFDTLVWREVALEDVQRKTADFGARFLRGDDGPLPAGLLLHCRQRYQETVKMRPRPGEELRNEADLADVFDGALAPYVRDPARRQRAVAALIAYEIETERRVLVADPAMRTLLEELRAAGKTLVLVSDMYFDETHVRALLDHLGLLALFDHVFVSATVGVTKHSGLLFAHIDAALGLAGRRRIHFGDNWNNDTVQPRRMGWDALHYLNPENEVRKDRLEFLARMGANARKGAAHETLAGLLSGGAEDALTLTAGAFSVFARRVVERAVQGGYDRILFLTRDGTIYRELAEGWLAGSGVAGVLDLPPMADLAFSRRAGVLLNAPDPEAAPQGWRDWLWHNVPWLSQRPPALATILRTFSVAPAELALPPDLEAEVAACLAGDDPDSDLGFDLLEARPELYEPLKAALTARRDRVRGYLDQMGLFDRDEKILLVDIGYSGTAAKALSDHIAQREAEGLPVRTRLSMMLMAANRYYKGNLGQMHPRVSLYRGTLIDVEDWRHRALAANYAWLEPFAVDRSRGSLRDYDRAADGAWVPRFAPGAPGAPGAPDRAAFLAAAARCEAALRQSRLPCAAADALVGARMTDMFLTGAPQAVAAMADLSHHGGLGEVAEDAVLLPIRPLGALRGIRTCLKQDKWLQGSLRASRLGLLIPLINRAIGLATR